MEGQNKESCIEAQQPLIADDLQIFSKPKLSWIRTWVLNLLLTATLTATVTLFVKYEGKPYFRNYDFIFFSSSSQV